MKTKARIRYSFKKILTGSDLSRRKLPFMSAETGREGPVLFLTACCHGDEVGGIVIIQEIFKKIQRDHILNRGAVYAFPLMNPIGFEAGSRHIPFSKEDLNRSFPGDPGGSLGERIADTIFKTILETRPALVIDLHNDWIKSIPYTLIDPQPGPGRRKVHEKTRRFAGKTGLSVVRDTEALHRSLSYSLQGRDIPAMTLELGESYIINEINIEYGVKSIGNIMASLRMTNSRQKPFQYPVPKIAEGKILHYSSKPYSSTSGIIRFLTTPGDTVRKNQSLAKIYDTFGKLKGTMIAAGDGIVLGHADSSVAYPGMPVMAFGNIDPSIKGQKKSNDKGKKLKPWLL